LLLAVGGARAERRLPSESEPVLPF